MKCIIVLALIGICTCAWVKDMENPGLYQGDMVLSPIELEQVKKGTFGYSALKDPRKLWHNSIVPYTIDSTLAHEKEAVEVIKKAIEEYHKYTCIQFKQRTTESSYVTFYNGGGCSSAVGFHYGKNSVSLSRGCWYTSTVMHEIGHAIGLHHEQTRPDRDNFVTINENNIHPGVLYNFNKEHKSQVDSRNTNYDYLSMMHYGWNSFAVDEKKPSIVTKDPNYQYHIGQDTGFSRTDVIQLNRMYKCSKTLQPPDYIIIPGCYNLGFTCTFHALGGHCTDRMWKNYMTNKCRLACALCGNGTFTLPPATTPRTYVTPSECKDIVSNCEQIKDVCTEWEGYMRVNCGKTCKYCKPTTTTVKPTVITKPDTTVLPGECKDIPSNCEEFKHKCTEVYWEAYMKENCGKTCKYCLPTTTTKKPTVTTIPKTTVKPAKCNDKIPECKSIDMYCNNKDDVWVALMDAKCRKTCNLCGSSQQ